MAMRGVSQVENGLTLKTFENEQKTVVERSSAERASRHPGILRRLRAT